jgi:uncharacterized NAD(P)/FAD-binding protein YdhS
MIRHLSAEQAVQCIKSGDRVFVHGSAATPVSMFRALLARAGQVTKVELVAISTLGSLDWD